MTAVSKSNPYLVKKRIVDHGRLWGVKVQYNGREYKLETENLIKEIDNGKQVLVDYPGGDHPVILTTITVNGKKVLRTLFDGQIKNNFAKVPKIVLITANKLRVLGKK